MLETERLLIRSWRSDDQELALQLWGDPRVMQKLGGALEREGVLRRLAVEMDLQERLGVQYWKLTEKIGGDFVGCAGLRPASSGKVGAFEVGFHIVPEKWGKGFATEAAKAVIGYGFERLQLPKLFAGHHPANVASSSVLQKLGFKQIGTCYYPPTGLQHPWYELPFDGSPV
jgi:[ribosomal protein S5]-alanine N-acetyltransferase